jgi:DNA-binding PadR family transcriptional regulator
MAIRDDAALLILTSLAGGAKHGYAMIDDIKTITGARLGPGTLYGAIARLEAEGMIVSLKTDDRRRPYEITAAGRRRLEAEIGGMRDLVTAGLRRLRRA